jgi:uncharacterized protein YcbK (DUF882 family)
MPFPAKNFTRSEFACRCGCGADAVDAELLQVLQDLRNHFGKPISIHCGIRCPPHNAREGGKPDSLHLVGKAADFHIEGVDHQLVHGYLNAMYPDTYGIGLYSWGIHLDVRTAKARW